MILLEIDYACRVHHRRSTCCGMDSEPAGSSIEKQTYRVVIADEGRVDDALAWFDQSQSHQTQFERTGHRIVCSVQAILRRPITNLNLV